MRDDVDNRHPAPEDPHVDKRVRRSRATVLAYATELLESRGVGGFSIDEVARRSGVAKTTIYRHWHTREDLILEACSTMDGDYTTPDTGTVHGDLRAFVADISDMVRNAGWASVLPSVIDAAERSPDFAVVHSRIQRGHAAPVHEIIERATARGELPAGADAAVATASLLGPVFYRRWFSREDLDEEFLDTVTRQAVTTLTGGH
jgi:AcrR family transcriptional regulator